MGVSEVTWSKQHIHLALQGIPPAADGDVLLKIADDSGYWMYYPALGELLGLEQPAIPAEATREELDARLKQAIRLFKEDAYFPQRMASADGFNAGDRVSHATFGSGTISRLGQLKAGVVATVDFDNSGRKGLLLGLARLRRL